ncbi:T9SS type A sorting domain-containing protein [Flavimarina sp. Hel_I_48]|uniref:T9SS type A sorting domain-containing protein n=1 Tax=Flavimarina sp. Hel_I_48 TaxID=1392488 RepID=UPI0013DD752B|nr:T9SS type A sorting domain-containing protein [Flavimarina sp. Hel_I_48]
MAGSINAQTLVSDSFAGELPVSIEVVENDMYVSTFNSQKLYRFSLDDVNHIETVSNFDGPVWKIRYDPSNNDFYCIVLENPNSLSSVDLDQTIPIAPVNVEIVTGPDGIAIDNDMVYVSDLNNIYKMDIATGNYSLLYNEEDGKVRNPAIYNGELYYQVQDGNSNEIYKIDVSSENPTKILVSSTNTNGILQSSLVVENFLYLGFESLDKILRIDLSDTDLPLTPSIVNDNPGAGVIGLANKDDTLYYLTGKQSIYQFTDKVLSSEESTFGKEGIYPIPSKNTIFHKGNSDYISYEIYSMQGTLVGSGNYTKSIDIGQLADGMYFLKFKSETGFQKFRFIKN